MDFDPNKVYLCLVEHGRAFFISDFDHAWGDDWDDAPYEHNAGYPYNYDFYVYVDDVFEEPCGHMMNSPWSVEDINAGKVPWLRLDWEWTKYEDGARDIYAGVSFSDFVRLVHLGQGEVYIPFKWLDANQPPPPANSERGSGYRHPHYLGVFAC